MSPLFGGLWYSGRTLTMSEVLHFMSWGMVVHGKVRGRKMGMETTRGPSQVVPICFRREQETPFRIPEAESATGCLLQQLQNSTVRKKQATQGKEEAREQMWPQWERRPSKSLTEFHSYPWVPHRLFALSLSIQYCLGTKRRKRGGRG